jgi:hypothetical protein
VKDVDGVYERDPAPAREAGDPPPRRFAALSYRQAIGRAARLIQPKAVQCRERVSASAEVAALASHLRVDRRTLLIYDNWELPFLDRDEAARKLRPPGARGKEAKARRD